MTDNNTIPATPGPNAPTQPLVTVGTITAIGAAVVGTVVAFGANLSTVQTGAILTLIGVVAPIVVAIWGRSKVYSPATVRAMVKSAERRQ